MIFHEIHVQGISIKMFGGLAVRNTTSIIIQGWKQFSYYLNLSKLFLIIITRNANLLGMRKIERAGKRFKRVHAKYSRAKSI